MTDRTRLREAAMKATPGPWMPTGYGISAAGHVDTYSGPVWGEIARAGDIENQDADGRSWWCGGSRAANAEFIAMCDPQTILSLLDDLEARIRAPLPRLTPKGDRWRE